MKFKIFNQTDPYKIKAIISHPTSKFGTYVWKELRHNKLSLNRRTDININLVQEQIRHDLYQDEV